MTDSAKEEREERASIRRVERLIDWLCDDPKPKRKSPRRKPLERELHPSRKRSP